MTQNDELSTARARLCNAQAQLLELDHAERTKTLRSVSDCLRHIVRFAEAMKSVPIHGMNERKLWLDEIASQLDFSRTLLEDPQV